MWSPSQSEGRWGWNSQSGFFHTSALARWQKDGSAGTWGGLISCSPCSLRTFLSTNDVSMLSPEEYREFLRGSSGLPKAEAGRYPVGLDQKLAQHHV